MGPDETLFEPAFSSAQGHRDFPSFHVSADSGTRQQHRKSPRTRPSQLLEAHHAEPLSPLKQADHTQKLQNRQSAMSLFSLFSKPKVEKAHGYAEPGLSPLPSRRALDENGSRHYLSTPDGTRDGGDVPFRAPSALSFRGRGGRSHRAKNAIPVSQVSRKHVPNEALPLFQAFPQATKYGVLEVSTMSAETVLQKSRSRRTAGSQSSIGEGFSRASVEDAGNGDTRRAAKTTMKHFANGSISHEELPSKMFVLINSGYLLQYREDGPSNRLPEKVLELGEESAAFACDLIPGRHHVLQVSQAVDSQGVMLAPTSSLLSKLRFRSAADKLPASHFLLVMPSAKEMEKWMAALREEIEGVGGKEVRAESDIRPWTEEVTRRDGFNELKTTPSKSHRYQVKRESSIAVLPENIEGSERRLSRLQDEEEKSETATLDGIERQADQLAEGAQASLHRNAPEHDAQSTSSSIAFSEQQKRLSSIRESRRMSHATVATTIAPSSRANSMTGSAQSEYSNKGSSEATRENVPTKSPYRMLASYAVSRRRSAMPTSTPRDNAASHQDAYKAHRISVQPEMESLASSQLPRDRPLPALPSSPRKLGVATSEPNLRNAVSTKTRHDSKMPSPPPSLEEAVRPESVVGELPSPSNWNVERFQNKHASVFHAASSDAPQPAQRTFEPSQARRSSGAKSFSLPLRVNPPNHNCPPKRPDNGTCNPVDHKKARELRASDPAPAPELPQKLPCPTPTYLQPLTSPKPGNNFRQPSRAPSGNLSLFPPASPALSQPGTPSPSDSPGLSPHSLYPGNPRALRRPTSMQVRSNPAPFLQSMRASSGHSPPSATAAADKATSSRSFTAPPPIRNLKPSRSASTMHSPSQPPFPLSSPASTTNPNAAESTNQSTPLPHPSTHSPSPLLPHPPPSSTAPSRPAPASRPTSTIPTTTTMTARKIKTQSSLPELDLGIPVVGLGPPPAPAPKAPLPAPPSQQAQTSRRTGSADRSASAGRPASRVECQGPMGRVGVGLGVRV
ncbi:hypothetical protein KC332_g2526 [Hortaea werneckii]|uniref:PH domain-containing protein n=1 Tax=Hortaea werneckii TaxID=91943 RepID=A0A3M7INE6_HORWE|nr:hypothetical protein KC350_g11839 [Hortaea werneckii]KAI6847177.1 hypothetical protein KC358_g2455 [Hortaea werneckii]KAI6900140.1 hypothetical protein KC348_g16927 [Hortaea werneckii]KAI6961654.1 hypothetical protein KC321_g12200 [Hortaea werneckii]KAI6990889.1 hypothetical protein KC329_g4437 [Hortaea werneckii]